MKPLLSPRVRQRLKAVVGTCPRPFTSSRKRVVVLCYHSIHPNKSYRSATPELFDHHLSWLKEHCEVVPFSSIPEQVGKRSAARPIVSITFDDGYDDNYQYALPALVRQGLTATFFVTAGFIEKEPDVLDRFRSLRSTTFDQVLPMTWDQIRELRSAGMEVGSHTWGHPNLALLQDGQVTDELTASRRMLEEQLGEPVTMLAFPFGKRQRHFTSRTVTLAEEAGYDMAAAVLFRGVRRSDSVLSIPRFFVRNDPLEELEAKLLGRYDIIGAWQEHAPRWAARLISPEDFAA